MKDFEEATISMKNKKGPRNGDILEELNKLLSHYRANQLLGALNAHRLKSFFRYQWKVARFALINKGRADPELPTAYRLLCMLDAAGTVFERIIISGLAGKIRASRVIRP